MMAAPSTDELREMLASATPGPWGFNTFKTSCGVCHKVGPWPHKWRAGEEMSACIYDDYPSPPEGTDKMLANGRLIALTPALAAEVIRLREALDGFMQFQISGYERMCDAASDLVALKRAARVALNTGETK